jgi:uridine kinase
MGKTILEFVGNIDYPYTCAIVNNQRMGFLDEVEEPNNIQLLSVEEGEGRRTYERTLTFLTMVAARRIDPGARPCMMYSIRDALYGEVESKKENIIPLIKEEINKLISENKEIKKYELTKESAIRKLEREGRSEDINAIRYFSKDTITLYGLDGSFIYFAGPLLPRTGMVKLFDFITFPPGFLILLPERGNINELGPIPQQQKLFEAFLEAKKWEEELEVQSVGDINKSIINGKISNIIKIQEALHEKKISYIADKIKESVARVVLIAGPSSSGKTTFAKKLEIQLRVNGVKPFLVSTDNYFVDREKNPLDKDGNPDYDCLEATDYKLLQQQIIALTNGEEVDIPKYNFVTGKRDKWRRIRLNHNGILVIEGIHALNPILTESISSGLKFKLYVSALSQVNIDNLNRIPTRDSRLIRRIVRDSHFRAIPASETLKRWNAVISSEEKYIFPYQENADEVFNSTLLYELAILRNYAEVTLRAIDYKEKEYAEALRLLNFLSHFLPLMPDEVPPTSILREFIGKSTFKY